MKTNKIFLAIRAVFYYFTIAYLAILFCLLLFIVLPLPFNKGRMQISRCWCKCVILTGKWICGMNYKIIGLENCPKTGTVYLAKHQSAWETIALSCILPNNCIVAKSSLLNIPFFGWGMRICKHIPIDRKAGITAFKKLIRTGQTRLREGLAIIIFPEGTRVPPGEAPKFHRTAVMLAKQTRAPIVPVAHNAGMCWRRNHFIKFPGTITVIIGQPIDSQSLNVDELNTKIYEWIKQEMIQLEGQTFSDLKNQGGAS